MTGIEWVIDENGKAMPKDKKQQKHFKYALDKKKWDMKKSLQYVEYSSIFSSDE